MPLMMSCLGLISMILRPWRQQQGAQAAADVGDP